MKKIRIDKLLVDMGLVQSRERARALIMAGSVLVNEVPVDKAGTAVDPESAIRLRGDDNPFVSRGGLKLEGAIEKLGIEVQGKTVLDVGASTGGFTDVCLQRGADTVFAVDVGTNQLVYSLRQDPRVKCLEKTNARNLTVEMLGGSVHLVVIDVSFISLTKILPAVRSCLHPAGEILAMVKPQFEVGKDKVGKGGVVRDEQTREEAIQKVIGCGQELGLKYSGRADSPIKGPKGNLETFVHFTLNEAP